MINELLRTIAITFLPFLELRASLPYGLYALGKQHWLLVFTVVVLANIMLGILLFYFIDFIILVLTKNKHMKMLYDYYLKRTQEKIKKYVDKYGELGVTVFIGIPLPGSGVYSGALAAYIIGLNMKKFIIANIIGVFIAGIIVLAVSYYGLSFFGFMVKNIN